MTQQEAIKELKRHKEEFFTDHGWNISVVDAIDMAIKALEQLQNCEKDNSTNE